MDTFTVTILFIFISALFVIIIRKLKKDKCLKDFQDNIVVLEKLGDQDIKGKLNVYNTGMEFLYTESLNSQNNSPEVNLGTSLSRLNPGTYLLYKGEYSSIQILTRYLDEQSEKARLDRERNMKRTFEPSKIQRFFRKLNNFLKTIKDSLLEIVNLVGNLFPVDMVLLEDDLYRKSLIKTFHYRNLTGNYIYSKLLSVKYKYLTEDIGGLYAG